VREDPLLNTRASVEGTFVTTFVISLGPEPRNVNLLGQLEGQGLSPIVVPAVDGRSWKKPFDNSLVDFKRFKAIVGREPTGPEIGCALSHMECARLATSFGARFALVMEEDAIVGSDLIPAINVIEELSQNSQVPIVLQLFSPTTSVLKRGTLLPVGHNNDVVGQFFTPPSATVAYLMNQAAIENFASKATVESVADWPPFASAFTFLGYFPSPVTHSDYGTTIDASRRLVSDRTKRTNRIFFVCRNYLGLFYFRRVREHSESLGGFLNYVKFVLIPNSQYLIRFSRTSRHKSGTSEWRVR
jgi:GR25 family glycosyltransferase involved in LPS biosynthesis